MKRTLPPRHHFLRMLTICRALFLLAMVSAQDAPELVLQVGHSKSISNICFSHDGHYFASCDDKKEIRFWDLRSGKLMRTIIPVDFKDHVSDILYSPDDRYVLVSGSHSYYSDINFMRETTIQRPYQVAFYDIHSGELARTISANRYGITNMLVPGDGHELICGGYDNNINFYNMESGLLTRSIKTEIHLRMVALSPDQKTLLAGGFYYRNHDAFGILKFYDLESGREIQSIRIGKGLFVSCVAYLPDRQSILVGSALSPASHDRPASIKRFALAGGKELGSYKTRSESVNAIFILPDGKHFVSGGSAGAELNQWDIETEEIVASYRVEADVNDIQITPDHRYFISAGGVEVLSPGPEAEMYLWNFESRKIIQDYQSKIVSLGTSTFTSDNHYIFSGCSDKRIRKFNLRTGKLELVSPPLLEALQSSTLVTVDLDKTNTYLIASANFVKSIEEEYNDVRILKTADLSLHRELPGIKAAYFLPGGQGYYTSEYFYKSTFSSYSTLKLWDTDSGDLIRTFERLDGNATLVQASQTCNIFGTISYSLSMTGMTSSVHLWDSENKKPLRVFQSKTTNESMGSTPIGVSLSHDCRKALISWMSFEDAPLRIEQVDIASGKVLNRIFESNESIGTAFYSVDDQRITTSSVIGGNKHVTKQYDAATGELLDANADYSIQESGNGVQMVAAGDKDANQAISIVDDAAAGPLFHIVFRPDSDDYIVYTPEKYYMSSKNGYEAIAFLDNNRVYSFEQFDLLYNRPDLVLKSLPGSDPRLEKLYHRAYQKRLEKMNFSEEMLSADFNIPEIRIENEAEIGIESASDTIYLSLQAEDSKTPLDRINVWVNDVPVFGYEGIDIRENQSMQYSGQIPIALNDGENKIQVSALNQQGAESFRATCYTSYTNTHRPPDLYVVSVGVSEYLESEYNLKYAAKDANDIADLFEMRKGQYGNVFVRRLTNQDATRTNILKLKETLMQSKVDDEVIIFLAGHGLLDQNYDYFLATWDMSFENPARNGLAYSDLEDLLNGIPARKKILMIDACHSGEIDRDQMDAMAMTSDEDQAVKFRGFPKPKQSEDVGLTNIFNLMKELFVDLRRGTGAIIISSSGGGEFAYESSRWNNGVFTYAFVDGIKSGKADTDQDGSIRVSEIREYVSEEVKRLTRNNQNPTSRRDNLEFDFPVW